MPKPLRKHPFRGKSWSVPPEGGGGEPAAMIVDEVSSETLVSTVSGVLWYPNFTHLSTLTTGGESVAGITPGPGTSTTFWCPNSLPAVDPAGPSYPGTSTWYQYVSNWDNNGELPISTSVFGTNHLRIGSQYPGDPDGAGDSSTILGWRKWFNHNTREVSNTVGLSTGPITSCFLRYMLMVESDVVNMTETGFKLPGFESHPTGCAFALVQWHDNPVSVTSDRVKMYRYDVTATHGTEQAVAGGDLNIIPESYFYLDTWHSVELQVQLNTASSANNAIYRVWLDDTLVHEYSSFNIWSTTGTVGVAEINYWRAQFYHGGNNLAPDSQIHYRIAAICMANRRIGKAKTV